MSASEPLNPRWRAQSLPQRLISGIVLAVAAVVAVWLGGWYFTALLMLVLLIALWEFVQMADRAGYTTFPAAAMVAGFSALLLAATHEAEGSGLVYLAVMVWMLAQSLRPPVEGKLAGLAITTFGLVYVIGLGIHVIWLRDLSRGGELLLVVLLTTWAADVFAFFVGVRWGKRKLAPHVSPGKSVEGVVAGFLGAALICAAASRWVAPGLMNAGEAALVGVLLGVAAPIGDLVESMCKRNLRVKDTSRMIPGHGGVLDRIDSLLLTVPLAYYLFRILDVGGAS